MSRFHPYRNIDPFKIPDTADKLLNEYWDIAETLGIKTFLLFGTCLGFVRGDIYIIGDNDIDVGILSGIDELTAELVKNGFIYKRTYDINRHFLKYGILLDIFFKFHLPLIDQKYLQSFDKVTYKGRDYNAPHPVEEYLKARYGDWKTKKLRKVWEA